MAGIWMSIFQKKADVLTYEKANGYVVYAKWVRTINNEYSVEHYNYRSNKKSAYTGA